MPKRAPAARCADPKHKGSRVIANGTYRHGTGRVRRYLCDPGVGDPHTFGIGIEGGRRVRGQQGAPVCASHAGSAVRVKSQHVCNSASSSRRT